MKLRSKMLSPPFGFFFLERDISLNGGTFDGTIELIKRHRKSNGYPPGDPERELEEFTCGRAPGLCDKSVEERIRGVRPPSLTDQTGDFLGNYSRWALTGFKTVDQVVANNRAAICEKCPANQQVKIDERRGCCGAKKIVTKLASVSQYMSKALTWPALKNKVTPSDNSLFTCAVCQCPNRASIWLPEEVFKYSAEMQDKFRLVNPKCWKVVK